MNRIFCHRLWPAWMPAPITALRQGGQPGIRVPNGKVSLHAHSCEKNKSNIAHHGLGLSGIVLGRSPPALALIRTLTGGAFTPERPVSFCAPALSNAAKVMSAGDRSVGSYGGGFQSRRPGA